MSDAKVRDRREWPDLSIAAYDDGAPMILFDGLWRLDDNDHGRGSDRIPGARVLRIGGGS